MGWLSGWTYRKTITVPAVTVEQSNINLLISIAYTAGMQDDFDDIRFTSSDGASQLYCYKDSYTASTSAIYAIKVPTIPVAGTTLYMYFGNAIATDPSDGANTFLFFDDFSGDLSQWDVDNPARCIIESGTLKFWGIYGDGSKGCRTKGTYGIHTFARAKMRQITGGVWYKGFSFSESMVINKAYCY